MRFYMPEELERQLKKQAHKKHMSKEHEDAYVYGTMRKTGWKPSREEHKKKVSKKYKGAE